GGAAASAGAALPPPRAANSPAGGGASARAARLWDPSTGTEVRPTPGHTGVVDILQFSADGRTLRSFARDQHLLHWDLATGRAEGRLMEGTASRMNPAAPLSADGKLLVRGLGPDRSVRLWDTVTGQELRLLAKHEGEGQGV